MPMDMPLGLATRLHWHVLGGAGHRGARVAAAPPSYAHSGCTLGAGPVFPIYLGDDVADEDAFAAVRARGGLAILVSDSVVARDQTAATYRLRSPKHVHKLLAKLSSMLPPALE